MCCIHLYYNCLVHNIISRNNTDNLQIKVHRFGRQPTDCTNRSDVSCPSTRSQSWQCWRISYCPVIAMFVRTLGALTSKPLTNAERMSVVTCTGSSNRHAATYAASRRPAAYKSRRRREQRRSVAVSVLCDSV